MEAIAASIIKVDEMIGAGSSSENSVNFYRTTRRHIPADNSLYEKFVRTKSNKKLQLTRYIHQWENNIKMYITGTGRFDDWNEMNRIGFNDRLL
jgi:hypothetical protein